MTDSENPKDEDRLQELFSPLRGDAEQADLSGVDEQVVNTVEELEARDVPPKPLTALLVELFSQATNFVTGLLLGGTRRTSSATRDSAPPDKSDQQDE